MIREAAELMDAKGKENEHRKPMLTASQQVEHLKAKGVKFELCSEKEAIDYLEHTNNYLRTASYRKLYPIKAEGPHAGEYIGLDFAALIALSSVDRVLRSALREICIDVEHFAHVELINRCMAHKEDGYKIIEDYFAYQRAKGNIGAASSLMSRSASGRNPDTYSGNLIAHYTDDLGRLSIWAFLEVIEFGRFADFWLFCARRWNDTKMFDEHYVLKSVKGLRNATCHNSCIVHGLTKRGERAGFEVRKLIATSMKEYGLKNTKSRRAKPSNLYLAQIAATLYADSEYCTRPSTKKRHIALMNQTKLSVETALPMRPADGSLGAYFDFLFKMVDIWIQPNA